MTRKSYQSKPLTSRNVVAADFCATNNVGYNADVNLIYSDKGYVPRSATLNLTLDFFGQSVNLFEVKPVYSYTDQAVN